MSDSIIIRPLNDADLPAVADLLNRTDFIPASEGYPISPDALKQHLEECGTVLFLVAESQEHQQIVGTLYLDAVSEQRVAHPKEVFATGLLIHPEFRSGSIPNQLFIIALRTLLSEGYDCLSATVNPANVTALSLYKRIGLYRTRSCAIDYDGQLELCGYQPLIIRAMKAMHSRQTKEEGMVRPEHGWRFLTPPSSLRDGAYDTDSWHDLEVATYDIHDDDWQLLFRIDVQSRGLVEMKTDTVHFQFYPQMGPNVFADEPSFLVLELTNCSAEPCMYGVDVAQIAPAILPQRVFQPGETWRQLIPLSSAQLGRQEFLATLQLPQCTLDFRTGINVHAKFEAHVLEPAPCIMAHMPWHIPVQCINARALSFQGTLSASSPTLPALFCTPDTLLFAEKEAVQISLSCPGAPAGAHTVTFQVIDTQGRVYTSEPLIIPVFADNQVLAYQQRGSWMLASPALSLEITSDTGYLKLWDRPSGRLLIREVWPDLGPPLPGGLKRSRPRSLSCVSFSDTQGAVLTIQETLANGELLLRSLRFVTSHLLEISQQWRPSASSLSRSKQLRTLGWCMFRQDLLTVPLKTGLDTRPVIYGDYPFLRHELETVPFSDLPRQTDAYSATWAAFTEGNLTVGSLWEPTPGSEVRFAGHLLPSLVFTLPAKTEEPWFQLPTYAYYAGRGGSQEIAHLWQQFYAPEQTISDFTSFYALPVETPDPSMPTMPREDVRSFLRLVRSEKLISEPALTITHQTKLDHYLVDNGVLRWQVCPQFAGSMVNLTYRGTNLLQSSWPRARTFGNHNPWYGGIHPAYVEDREDLLQGLISDGAYRLQFQAHPCEHEDDLGQRWQGISLAHNSTSFSYETLPGLPLLRLSITQENHLRIPYTANPFFQVFLRNLQGVHIPRSVHYERMGRPYALEESKRSRRVYTSGWSVAALGKNIYVAFGSSPSSHLEVATYEWPRDGFQHALLHPFRVAPGQRYQVSTYLWVTHSLALAQEAVKSLSSGTTPAKGKIVCSV